MVSSGGLTRRGLGVLYPSTVVRREDALVVGYSFWCIVRRYMCEDRSTNLSPKTVLQHVLAYLWYIRVFLQDRTIFGVKLSINDHIVRLVHKNHIIRTCLMYHAACKVEFQPFKRSYSQLTFFNFYKKKDPTPYSCKCWFALPGTWVQLRREFSTNSRRGSGAGDGGGVCRCWRRLHRTSELLSSIKCGNREYFLHDF